MSVPDVCVPTVRLYHSRCVALMCINEPEAVGIANRSIHCVCLHEYTALKSPNIGRNGLSGRLQFSSMPVFAGMGGVCVHLHAFNIRSLPQVPQRDTALQQV